MRGATGDAHAPALVLASVLAAALACQGCGGAPAPPAIPSGESPAAAAARNPVVVSPLPGTRDASAQTQISFLGAPGTSVSRVAVLGSRSGAHSGVLRRYSTGTGESFLPTRPFLAGETVQVHARVQVGARVGSATTTFSIAYQARVSQAEFAATEGDPRAVQHYISAPALTPPTVTFSTPPQRGAAPGDLFLAPYLGSGSAGPMIVDQRGSLVWFHPLPSGIEAANFSVQRYGGEHVLTWWQGRILRLGFGEGEDVLYDRRYRPLARVRAGNGYSADLHIIRLTSQGTAWIDAFDPVRVDLAKAGGPRNGVLSDSVIQEIDVRTGLVMWEWHAMGHIAVSESHTPPPHGDYPWDYAHVNSLDEGPAGDLLLSARNTWAVYDIDLHSGAVVWRLGGPRSSFTLGAGARFYWQHDAHFDGRGVISLFDNGADPPEERQSRALVLRLDSAKRRVALVRQFANPNRTLLSPSQGNALRLRGGNWLVGYGGLPAFTEFARDGHVLLDGSLGPGVQSFITSLARWSGQPLTAPSLAVRTLGAGLALVAASWNGATAVRIWRVLEGPAPGRLHAVASIAKRTFESTAEVPLAGRCFAVEALGHDGAVLGRSSVVGA